MAFVDVVKSEVETILDIKWNERSGKLIPETDDIALKDGAVEIEATFLYADLAGSSILAKKCPWQTTAKIIRAYLDTSVRIIRAYGGEIRSFDGDRVMGIFKGDNPNSTAANCARKIDWIVESVINPKAQSMFTSIKDNSIKITHCIGIDTGIVRAVRAGLRNNNDLIWIGKAPSFAAKLSDVRNYPFSVYISADCYNKLAESAKKSAEVNVWAPTSFTFAGSNYTVYHTSHMLTP